MGGQYQIYLNAKVYNATPRGNLKLNKLYVGDYVDVSLNEYGTGYVIEKVLERFNTLVRPPLSNIDQIVLVIAPIPKPDFVLIDKLIINAKMLNIDVVIVVNKSDVEDLYSKVCSEYSLAVSHILSTSAQKNEGIEDLKNLLKNKFSCFVGQSAVGKSTLLNAINPTINAETGSLSKKIERGKNTTRHSEIYVFDDILIADTPGFSLYGLDIDCNDIKYYYPEFQKYTCKYLNCNHFNENENECEVIKNVNLGLINLDRYLRYKEIYKQVKEKWQNLYK